MTSLLKILSSDLELYNVTNEELFRTDMQRSHAQNKEGCSYAAALDRALTVIEVPESSHQQDEHPLVDNRKLFCLLAGVV